MKKIIKNITTTIIMVSLSTAPIVSNAAVDMFLKIDGVEGEAQDKAHNKSIDVLAWSWGASSKTTKRGKFKCSIQDVSITKYADSATPALLMGQLEGVTYDNAELIVRKSGGNQLEYITISFNNVSITSLSTGGSGGEDRLTENVTLNFSNATYTYTPQNDDGSSGTPLIATIGGC
jgi:type VI secretion system secreted protein Hcp